MPIKIYADIVDITSDMPESTDVFFVDTNIWYWVGYTNASQSSHHNQSVDYPTYINQALEEKSKIYKCTLSFAELAHSIERSEYLIFKASSKNTNPGLSMKQFRHEYPTQRQNVVTEIENVWNLAEAITAGNTIEINVDNSLIENAIRRIKSEELDGYDIFMVESLLAKGISQVITDDGDFGQVKGITVFTANQRLIREARKQKKLLSR